MADKQRYPRAAALKVAKELCDALAPACERIIVAGSLRRRKADVGDVEILYIPKVGMIRDGLFEQEKSLADLAIADLERRCVLSRRLNANGSEMFGDKNKLMRHTLSGIPVDLFATTAECWANYLVCRTGGAETNKAICMAAMRQGWKWNPYGPGFTDREGAVVRVASEREVFELAGLAFQEPEDRR